MNRQYFYQIIFLEGINIKVIIINLYIVIELLVVLYLVIKTGSYDFCV